MVKINKNTSQSLHSLSHAVQSLLTRIQADNYVAQQLVGQFEVKKSARNFSRIESSVRQTSEIVNDLFQSIYLASEPYKKKTGQKNLLNWWHELESSFTKDNVLLTTHAQTSSIKADWDLLTWLVERCTKAAQHWRQPSTQIKIKLNSLKKKQYQIVWNFEPLAGADAPINPNNEKFTLGWFYWSGAQLAAKHLGAKLTPKLPQKTGTIKLVWN